jgi:hypothetical protein
MRSTTERTYACAVTPLLAERYWQLYLSYGWKGPIPFAFQAPRPRPIGRFAPDSSVHTHGSQFSAADGPSSSRHFRAEPVLRPRIPASQHDSEERLPVSPLARRIASVRATRIDCNQAAVGQFAGRTDLISQYRSRAAPADRLLYITVRKNSDRRRHILRPDRRHGLPPALACDRISPDASAFFYQIHAVTSIKSIIYRDYGGEGGIRTPDSLTTMPDFESGAFNRALPPLRFVLNCLQALSHHFVLPYRF